MAYTKYSLTPANNNATPPDGAPEGMLPSAVNDTMRDMMAQIRDVGDGIRDGTYTMTAAKITGGTITGVAFTGNTFTSPVISGGSINNTPIGASTANTGAFTTLSASGVATFSAGTVSAPAITTTGDTNTGIFFPAADTIAFTEGGVESGRFTSTGALQLSNNLTFTGTGNRITGDFSNATQANRVAFQTSTVNGVSTITVLPNGTAIQSTINLFDNSDPTNAGTLNLFSNTTEKSIRATITGTGTYLPLTMYTGGSERLRIDTSGNVGIGTSSPSARLDVQSTQGVQKLTSTTGTNSVYQQFINTGGNAYVGLNNSTGADFGNAAYALQVYHAGAYPIVFATNNTERMRITSGGNVLVGQSSLDANAGGALFQLTQNNANWIHYITNTASTGTVWGQYILYTNQAPNNTTSNFFFCADNAALRATFRSNGGLANYSGNDVNLSDAREKTNIELAGSYLDKICAIPVKTFNYIDQNREEDDGLTLGVLAQDVQAVAPELVMESNWAAKNEPEKMRLSIYQTDLQYALMKSIQELKAIVDAQAAEIALLKSK